MINIVNDKVALFNLGLLLYWISYLRHHDLLIILLVNESSIHFRMIERTLIYGAALNFLARLSFVMEWMVFLFFPSM